MGTMCLVWKYRLVASVILVLVVCGAFGSDGAQPVGKVYPRGNHWAVGHLMGKKSTDEQLRFEDPYSDPVASPDQEQQPDRDTQPLLRLLQKLMGGQNLLQRLQEKRRQWEEDQERERQLKQVEDLLLQALNVKDDSAS